MTCIVAITKVCYTHYTKVTYFLKEMCETLYFHILRRNYKPVRHVHQNFGKVECQRCWTQLTKQFTFTSAQLFSRVENFCKLFNKPHFSSGALQLYVNPYIHDFFKIPKKVPIIRIGKHAIIIGREWKIGESPHIFENIKVLEVQPK